MAASPCCWASGDNLTGLHAAFGTVMALLHKHRVVDTAVTANGHVPGSPSSTVAADGLGQVVDASISESMFNMLEACVSEVAMAGEDRQPSGSTISGQCDCCKGRSNMRCLVSCLQARCSRLNSPTSCSCLHTCIVGWLRGFGSSACLRSQLLF